MTSIVMTHNETLVDIVLYRNFPGTVHDSIIKIHKIL